jgi:hypothetical protein
VAPLHFCGGQSLVPTIPTGSRKIKKRAFINPDFVQLRIESAQKFVAKAGSNSTSKFKLLPFVETNKQRAKMFPRSFRFGEPAYDKFLLSGGV